MLKAGFYLFITLFLAFAACRNTQERQNTGGKEIVRESADSSATARIKFAKDTHDFGDFAQGEIVTHTFKFKNTGDKSLLIQNIETSCGCLSASYDKKPIPPGEEGSIEVQFDSKGQYGKQYKIITIFANIPEKVTEIKVLANINY